MIYNYCITCEHYNDWDHFPEECYGCFNGRNYNVNHYYDMTKEDIENMIKSEEEENAMNNGTNYDAELKLDIVESDIIDELLALTKKNNEMLIDIQKRLDESEGLIWPKHPSEENCESPWLASANKNKEALIDIQNGLNKNEAFDEKKIIETIIGDQEKEDAVNSGYTREEVDEVLNRIRRNSFYGMYADYPKILESNHIRDELKETCDEIDRKLLDEGWNINKKGPCTSHRSCSDCVHANTAFNAEPCNSCEGYTNYKERKDSCYIGKQSGAIIPDYDCDKCKYSSKKLYEEPCYSCSIPNGNYKFEPMSNVDKLEKRVCDAFANCANAVKEFNRRFNEAKEKK